MNSRSTEILAEEERLVALLLAEGESIDCLGGAASSSAIADALKSS